MHVRFSSAVGLPVVEEGSTEPLARIDDILLQPDSGRIEGFSVAIPRFLGSDRLVLLPMDILHWGMRITVRSANALVPAEDIVRLQTLLEDDRKILGQRMRTESGKVLGRCGDVQFDTAHFTVEWLFPRRWWTWGIPVPVSDVVEVRADAIIVRNRTAKAKEKAGATDASLILGVMPEA